VYVGVPEFLKMLLDKGRDAGRDIGSFRRALVSGGVLPPTLRHEFRTRGIATFQLYATADAGIIAYESEPQDAMIVDEGVIVEIVRPGTGETLLPGEIGEVVVTSFNRDYPMLRLATGDLSAVVPGVSACGRTNTRIRGWLGRADQSTRVRGTVVTPEQIAEIGKRHPDLNRLRLVITRAGNDDHVVLKAEGSTEDPALAALLTDTFAAITKTRGDVQIVAPGSLPRDGRVISDERPGA
jgi:phenylacetate-CoA ligase